MKYKILTFLKKKAVFDQNNKQISDWYDDIILSDRGYYLVTKGLKKAVFRLEKELIIDFSDAIYYEGFFNDETDFFIVSRASDDKFFFKEKQKYLEAVFDQKGNRRSEWYDRIFFDHGLFKRESEYFVVSKNKKYSVIRLDEGQISEWYDMIYDIGLIRGSSSFFLGKSYYRDHDLIKIYDHSGRLILKKKFKLPSSIIIYESDFRLIKEYCKKRNINYSLIEHMTQLKLKPESFYLIFNNDSGNKSYREKQRILLILKLAEISDSPKYEILRDILDSYFEFYKKGYPLHEFKYLDSLAESFFKLSYNLLKNKSKKKRLI